MTPRQQIFALTMGLVLFFFILRLVYQRRLREEYSWLWLLTGLGIVLLAVWYDFLVMVTDWIGAVLPTTTLFIFGLLFLMVITLHYSIKISALTDQVRKLSQQMALLEEENQAAGQAAGVEPQAWESRRKEGSLPEA